MSKWARDLISRLTLLVVTVALAYGSYRCIGVSIAARAETEQQFPDLSSRQQRRISGSGLPLAIGIGLGGLALVTGLGATMPWRFFERLARSPGATGQRIAAPRDYFKV